MLDSTASPSSADETMTISLSTPYAGATSASPAPVPPKAKTVTVPLSLPAILQNPKARLSHLAPQAPKSKLSSKEALLVAGVVGKRRRRRVENALLASNPHILRPSTADFLPRPAPGVPTFSPRPVDFPASLLIPPNELLVGSPNPNGQFTFSLKGVRRALRRSGSGGGARAQDVVELVERSLRAWLGEGGKRASDFHSRADGPEGRIIDPTPYLAAGTMEEQPAIVEFSRLPHALLWAVADPYDRFIVHCISRYYGVVSFSAADTARGAGKRVTHLLRPHIVRPAGGIGGETPPGTDLSATEGDTSAFDSADTDGSELGDSESDWEELNRAASDVGDFDDAEVSATRSFESIDYDTDEADADVGTDDDAASELEASLVDLRLATAPLLAASLSPRSPTVASSPIAMTSSPARPAFFPSPSTTPRPSLAGMPATPTPASRARRTRASFPPTSSRIREDGSESRSRSRSNSPVAATRALESLPAPDRRVQGGRKGWQWPEQTFAAFVFS